MTKIMLVSWIGLKGKIKNIKNAVKLIKTKIG